MNSTKTYELVRRFFSPLAVTLSVLLVIASISYVWYDTIRFNADFLGVFDFQKVSALTGGMTGVIDSAEGFGRSVDNIGDLDGDGVEDLVVGAMFDDAGGVGTGSAYILFMNSDGTVSSNVRIGSGNGGFTGTITGTNFGSGVAGIGDMDDDGVLDVAVGAISDSDGGALRGAVWILFMNTNGTVKSHQKISDTAGSFTGTLSNNDFFGSTIASLGDLNGDGVEDIVVGANGDDEDGTETGSLWVLFLDDDGTVQSHQKINESNGGFGGEISTSVFGFRADSIGDLDLDGNVDLLVGAWRDGDGGVNAGAAWILFLDDDGTVLSEEKISQSNGIPSISAGDAFGTGVTKAGGDMNGDGIPDVVVGGLFADKVWTIFLDRDGNVLGSKVIGSGLNGFTPTVTGTRFGISVTDIKLRLDGPPTIVVGAEQDGDGGVFYGAIWTLFTSRSNRANLDQDPPINLGFTINDGASCTTDRVVDLELYTDSAFEFVVGHTREFHDAKWIHYINPSPMKNEWKLEDGDGLHEVHVAYRSDNGDLSHVARREIILDTKNNCQNSF